MVDTKMHFLDLPVDEMGTIEACSGQVKADRAQATVESCEVFSADLPTTLSAKEVKSTVERVESTGPWSQGPFWVGGDVVIGDRQLDGERWSELRQQVEPSLAGKRVLVVGANAGYDAFMFSKLGSTVVACEDRPMLEQATLLEGIYKSGVSFQPLSWSQLSVEEQGKFDIIHCNDLLHRELNPAALIGHLNKMLSSDGTLYLGTMMLRDPIMSEFARFIPIAYAGDQAWWWVPGRLCLRWMLEISGFNIDAEFGVTDGPDGEFDVVHGYFKTTIRE